MSTLPEVPPGTGRHPIPLVVLSANRLAESRDFYARLFGWPMHAIGREMVAAMPASGPGVTLRSGVPEGFPGTVPYIGVPDVPAALDRVVAAGGSVERAPWTIPMAGTMARFRDPSGTLYGVLDGRTALAMPRVPMPLGANPRPPAHTVCSLEMFAADLSAAAGFFGALFGWGTKETMPGYVAFDPGAGIGGVFQGHTPATRGMMYVYVTDVAATLVAIEGAGGKRMSDAMAMPGLGTFGYFTDPSGTSAGLIGP